MLAEYGTDDRTGARTAAAKNRKSPKRVLIVEDDLAVLTVFEEVLKEIDPHVIIDWVTSAEQAAAMLKARSSCSLTRPYDLVLADIFLEGRTSGVELWVQCSLRLPDVPVVVTSGMPAEEFFAAIGQYTIAPPFLPKPFLPEECYQTLEGAMAFGTWPR